MLSYKFINRVISERIVDSTKYRYIFDGVMIKRLPIELLDTTAVFTRWEVVKCDLRRCFNV